MRPKHMLVYCLPETRILIAVRVCTIPTTAAYLFRRNCLFACPCGLLEWYLFLGLEVMMVASEYFRSYYTTHEELIISSRSDTLSFMCL